MSLLKDCLRAFNQSNSRSSEELAAKGEGLALTIVTPEGHAAFYFPFDPQAGDADEPARALVEACTQYMYESGLIRASDGRRFVGVVEE